MPRKPRHITQRGNTQQPAFTTDADPQHFLSLLDTGSEERHIRIGVYSLMWVSVGDRPETISRFMMDVNGQYAIYVTGSSGSPVTCGKGASIPTFWMTPTGKTALR